MISLDQETLINGLTELGISSRDILLVHSDLRCFGVPEGADSREKILQFYLDAFLQVLGKEGTLAVPAYFYEYARFGIPFDVDQSPVSAPLGSFSQWINSLPNRVRSLNPLQSLAAIGWQASELTGGDSVSGYGAASPWHRLRTMGGKILFLGAPFQSMTYVHYIEQQFGVPHLYFKIYPYPIIKDKKTLPKFPISAVRYLNFEVEYDLAAFKELLQDKGALHTAWIKNTAIYLVEAEAAFQIGMMALDQNPYFFLKNPPKFVSGQIPTDGTTGK